MKRRIWLKRLNSPMVIGFDPQWHEGLHFDYWVAINLGLNGDVWSYVVLPQEGSKRITASAVISRKGTQLEGNYNGC